MEDIGLKRNKIEKEIKYADLFGGVGGFRLGIERATNKKSLQQGTRSSSHLQSKRNSTDSEGDAWKNNKNNTTTRKSQNGKRWNSSNTNGGELSHKLPDTTCVFYCDNDKYAVQTYNKNFKENWKPTDIRTIKADSIPDFDMLCGGFPDNWTEGVSDTQRYKQMGNAVTVNVIQAIAEKLLK